MEPTHSGLWKHLRLAAEAMLLLAVFQIALETAAVVVLFRGLILTPYLFFPSQMYDFCAKLVFLFPGAAEWVRGGLLDRFVFATTGQGLAVGAGLVLPNLLVGGGLAFLVAVAGRITRRPATTQSTLLLLASIGLLVHIVSFVTAVHWPQKWTAWLLARNAARTLIWDRALVAFAVWGIATASTAIALRLQSRARRAASLASLIAVAIICVVVAASRGTTFPTVSGPSTGMPFSEAARADNVVLISIDSLRADRLGCYGNPHDTSPGIDRLARTGVRFADATSTTSWTLPAHMSMLTGRHVLSHGVLTDAHRLPPSVPTLAEVLRQDGFSTGGVISMEYLESRYGFGRGFDDYYDHAVPHPGVMESDHNEPAPVITRLALAWMRQHAKERFFLFLHFWDVHYDYIPPPPYDTMFDPDYSGILTGDNFYYNRAINARMAKRDLQHIFALYDGEIRWVDTHVEQVLRTLDELGVGSRTAVIVTADHGDEFLEHGFKGHRRTLYREVTHIPLIVRAPGLEGGRVVREPASLTDIMPTILDLAGVAAPPGIDGRSLVSAMAGKRRRSDRPIYAELYEHKKLHVKALQRTRDGTLIYSFVRPRVEFYEAADVAQRQDVADTETWSRRERLRELTSWLSSQWDRYRAFGSRRPTVEMDEAMKERLRALGYAD